MDADLEPAPASALQLKAQMPKVSSKNKDASSKTMAKIRTRKSAQKRSKQDLVVAMLRRKEGATIATIMKATGWQKHSVHGFFAGIVRKKLKLNLVRTAEGEKAAYRIASGKPQRSAAKSSRRLAVRKFAKRPQKSAAKRSR